MSQIRAVNGILYIFCIYGHAYGPSGLHNPSYTKHWEK